MVIATRFCSDNYLKYSRIYQSWKNKRLAIIQTSWDLQIIWQCFLTLLSEHLNFVSASSKCPRSGETWRFQILLLSASPLQHDGPLATKYLHGSTCGDDDGSAWARKTQRKQVDHHGSVKLVDYKIHMSFDGQIWSNQLISRPLPHLSETTTTDYLRYWIWPIYTLGNLSGS